MPGMIQDILDEFAIGGETGVVPIVDVVARDDIAALIGLFTLSTSFDIAAVRQQFMADKAVFGHPKAGIIVRLVVHLLLFLGNGKLG